VLDHNAGGGKAFEPVGFEERGKIFIPSKFYEIHCRNSLFLSMGQREEREAPDSEVELNGLMSPARDSNP
jgi:hypothetical protein